MKRSKREFRKLYIGPWLARLDRKPSDVAKKVGVTEGYLSLIISDERKNPSHSLLFDLARELGISIDDFYRRPPEREVTERITKLRPDQLAVLSDLLDQLGKRRKS